MKQTHLLLIGALACTHVLQAQQTLPTNAKEDKNHIMSEYYWNLWNPEVQAEIDRKIEKNRKGDAVLQVPANTTVRIEQVSHSFLFGGNIFLFGQLATEQHNKEYERTFGTLFDYATIPFYWKTLEPEQGKPRYEAGSSYIFRRPPTDPIVEFCEANHIKAKGHAMIYGLRLWAHPEWMPDNRKEMERIFENHIQELAERYKDKIQMWDVVNEPVDQANRGVMPDDYTYKTFRWAMKYFPDSVIFNINDIDFHSGVPYVRRYVEIVRNMIDRGVRIDNVGAQMHIFEAEEAQQIADGTVDFLSPAKLTEVVECLRETERPIHISEVTICSPDSTERGKAIQAILTRNLYRFWFSDPDITGITWWNIVDGGGAPGESTYPGIFDKNMQKKPAYYVLNHLINHEWKTNMTVKSDKNGYVKFRGFKGNYRITYTDKSGHEQMVEYQLK